MTAGRVREEETAGGQDGPGGEAGRVGYALLSVREAPVLQH